MKIQVNLNGRKRKELAQVIGNILDVNPIYKGAKDHHYEVGDVIVGGDGCLALGADLPEETIQLILASLEEQRFGCIVSEPVQSIDVPEKALEIPVPENTVELQKPEKQELEKTDSSKKRKKPENQRVSKEPEEPEQSIATPTGLTITLPRSGFNDTALENLKLLIASKATLIKKAMVTDDLSIEITEDTVSFPWFKFNPTPDEAIAYTQFVAALCDMAKRQKRVIAVDKAVENEKYAMRCFLLRLGFIGEEYADTRRILLQHLYGNGSWKSGDSRPKRENASVASGSALTKTKARETINHAPRTEPRERPNFVAKIRQLFRKQ